MVKGKLVMLVFPVAMQRQCDDATLDGRNRGRIPEVELSFAPLRLATRVAAVLQLSGPYPMVESRCRII